MQAGNLKLASATLALAALVAGCSDSATTNSTGSGSTLDPRLSKIAVSAGQLGVCKYSVVPGSDPFTNNLSGDPTSGTVRVLANGVQVGSDSVVGYNTSDQQCAVYTLPSGTTTLAVTETPTAGSALYFYRYLIDGDFVAPYAHVIPGGPTPNAYTIDLTDVSNTKSYQIWLKNVTYTPPPPSGGCTLTQGYWKTHSTYGPAPKADETWTAVGGPDASFFGSGKTWIQVFNTAPKGNSYYILAVQYMAAVLNQHAGASSTTDVTAALDWAANAFSNHPNPADAFWVTNKATAVGYATTLDDYNNGLIGPGHCSDEATR